MEVYKHGLFPNGHPFSRPGLEVDARTDGLETDARGMQTWYNGNYLPECFEPLYQPDETTPLAHFERDPGPLRDRILSQRRKWYELWRMRKTTLWLSLALILTLLVALAFSRSLLAVKLS